MARFRGLLAVLLTLGLLGAVLAGADLARVGEVLGGIRLEILIPLLLTFLLTHALRSIRYGLLVGASLSWGRWFGVCAIGFFAILVLPLRLGELARPALVTRNGVAFGRGFAGVVLERLLDMLMILGLLGIVAVSVEAPPGGFRIAGVDVILAGRAAFLVTLAVGVVAMAATIVLRSRLRDLVAQVPGLGPRLARAVDAFGDTGAQLVEQPVRAVAALGLSVLVWGTTVVQVGWLLAAFPEVPGGPVVATTVWTLTAVGMVVVPTPAGVGGYEAACAGSLLLFGTDPDVARTFAVVLHLLQVVATVGLGIPFLAAEGVKLSELVSRSTVPE